jgi:hypothetical protein
VSSDRPSTPSTDLAGGPPLRRRPRAPPPLSRRGHTGAAAIISDGELRERKVDLLEGAAPADRDALDELLDELLPLGDQGVVDGDDLDFLEQLAGGH